jgi:hypothetical protein
VTKKVANASMTVAQCLPLIWGVCRRYKAQMARRIKSSAKTMDSLPDMAETAADLLPKLEAVVRCCSGTHHATCCVDVCALDARHGVSPR